MIKFYLCKFDFIKFIRKIEITGDIKIIYQPKWPVTPNDLCTLLKDLAQVRQTYHWILLANSLRQSSID